MSRDSVKKGLNVGELENQVASAVHDAHVGNDTDNQVMGKLDQILSDLASMEPSLANDASQYNKTVDYGDTGSILSMGTASTMGGGSIASAGGSMVSAGGSLTGGSYMTNTQGSVTQSPYNPTASLPSGNYNLAPVQPSPEMPAIPPELMSSYGGGLPFGGGGGGDVDDSDSSESSDGEGYSVPPAPRVAKPVQFGVDYAADSRNIPSNHSRVNPGHSSDDANSVVYGSSGFNGGSSITSAGDGGQVSMGGDYHMMNAPGGNTRITMHDGGVKSIFDENPGANSMTKEQRNQVAVKNVLEKIDGDGAIHLSIEKETEEDEKAVLLEQIDVLSETLKYDSSVRLSDNLKHMIETINDRSYGDIKIVYKMLRLKNDRQRYATIAEESILGIAGLMGHIFDGKRDFFGYRPNLTDWDKTVATKLRRCSYETSTIVSDFMNGMNIGRVARIGMELIPSLVLHAKMMSQKTNVENKTTEKTRGVNRDYSDALADMRRSA
jgi:hypothetical protein